MKMKVLVYGYYGHNNIGDELFINAFRKIFPEIDFSFTDNIKIEMLKGVSAVFFGGGSFLYAEPFIENGAMSELLTKKIFYISVGTETDIHPIHQKLMKEAKLIATRTAELSTIRKINTNTIYIPDIIYSLTDYLSIKRHSSILILPNVSVVPQWDSPHWQHISWEYFKSEFAQFLDILIDDGYNINFGAMSSDKKQNDLWAIIEIITKMKHRSDNLIKTLPLHDNELLSFIAEYQAIITQRYHGMILSEITRTPYISIWHVDKLKNSFLNEGRSLSYYGIYKQKLLNSFYEINNLKLSNVLPINNHIIDNMRERVLNILDG